MKNTELLKEYLDYRGNSSAEEMTRQIATFIRTRTTEQRKELLNGLEQTLLEGKACFSTPVLLNVGHNNEETPRTASCYIVKADGKTLAELIAVQNNIFDGAGGVGMNLTNQIDIETALHAFEENARKRYCGLPTRGCSVGTIYNIEGPQAMQFITAQYGSESFQHVIRNMLVSDAFLARAKDKESKEHEQLLLVAENMASYGTPGILFQDTINKNQPYTIKATNPCAEFLCADDTAANLAALNLAAFVKKGVFDWNEFHDVARQIAYAQNVLLDNSSYPNQRIADVTGALRPIGTGMTNLNGALVSLGLAYDSPEARAFAAKAAKELANSVRSLGMGNTQTTAIAPTGRIGRLMGCEYLSLESNLHDETPEMEMMAAVQPFISGGISNTLVYKKPTTKEELIEKIYHAHSFGLKSFIAYVASKQ